MADCAFLTAASLLWAWPALVLRGGGKLNGPAPAGGGCGLNNRVPDALVFHEGTMPLGSKSCRPKPDTTANQAAGKINQPAGLASTGALPDPIRLRGDRQDKGDDRNHEDDG